VNNPLYVQLAGDGRVDNVADNFVHWQHWQRAYLVLQKVTGKPPA
jgi:hypothetical protein